MASSHDMPAPLRPDTLSSEVHQQQRIYADGQIKIKRKINLRSNYLWKSRRILPSRFSDNFLSGNCIMKLPCLSSISRQLKSWPSHPLRYRFFVFASRLLPLFTHIHLVRPWNMLAFIDFICAPISLEDVSARRNFFFIYRKVVKTGKTSIIGFMRIMRRLLKKKKKFKGKCFDMNFRALCNWKCP